MAREVEEALEKYGYRSNGQCSCDGYQQHKYKAGDYEFRWRKSRYLFLVRQFSRPICEWKPIAEAPEYLKQLHEPKTVFQATT